MSYNSVPNLAYNDIFSEITEKECILRQEFPHSIAKFRLVQHCAAISAIVELVLDFRYFAPFRYYYTEGNRDRKIRPNFSVFLTHPL